MAKTPSTRIIAGLKYPTIASIKGRSSTIRAEFIKAVIPEIVPTAAEIHEALTVLNQQEGQLTCAYCGDTPSEWDHFFSVVSGKQPTGFITEVYNLVPSCGKCNQSKGSKNWKEWIRGNTAALSPTARLQRGKLNISQSQLEGNIAALEAFEQWGIGKISTINFSQINVTEFAKYFESCEKLIDSLADYQRHAIALKKEVERSLNR